jgi:hypothetical protein
MAGFSLAMMLAAAVAVAIFAASAIIALVAGLFVLAQSGYTVWVGAMFGVFAISGLAGVCSILYIRSSSANLTFPATRSALFEAVRSTSDSEDSRQ